jgi:hypothetical protein
MLLAWFAKTQQGGEADFFLRIADDFGDILPSLKDPEREGFSSYAWHYRTYVGA